MFKAHDNRLSMMLVEFGVIVLGAVTVVSVVAGIVAAVVYGVSRLIWWLGVFDNEENTSIKKRVS